MMRAANKLRLDGFARIASGGLFMSKWFPSPFRFLLPAVLVPAVLLVVLSGVSNAQVLYGSITGNVSDPSGGAVPGATLEATEVNTGTTKKTTTNASAVYSLSDLQPGTYKITITSPAFATTVLQGVTVTANQVRRADASLQVAQVSQTVEVSAAEVTLQTDRADVNTTISSRQVN